MLARVLGITFQKNAPLLWTAPRVRSLSTSNPPQVTWNSDFYPNGHRKEGIIRRSILKVRFDFLKEKGLLQNKLICNIGMPDNTYRFVFANRHLLDPMQLDLREIPNLTRMESGKAPVGKCGRNPLIIHHFDQTQLGPWVIMEDGFHKEFHQELHSDQQPVDGISRCKFAKERSQFWQSEALRHSKL